MRCNFSKQAAVGDSSARGGLTIPHQGDQEGLITPGGPSNFKDQRDLTLLSPIQVIPAKLSLQRSQEEIPRESMQNPKNTIHPKRESLPSHLSMESPKRSPLGRFKTSHLIHQHGIHANQMDLNPSINKKVQDDDSLELPDRISHGGANLRSDQFELQKWLSEPMKRKSAIQSKTQKRPESIGIPPGQRTRLQENYSQKLNHYSRSMAPRNATPDILQSVPHESVIGPVRRNSSILHPSTFHHLGSIHLPGCSPGNHATTVEIRPETKNMAFQMDRPPVR